MNFPLFRSSLLLALLGVPLVASAVGLGELRGQPAMGESLRLEIDILGSARRSIEASCFRLVRPEGADDLPWLRQADLSVRSGLVPVLEIRSASPLRDPILQIGVHLGCGYEISRQYMLLAGPAAGAATPAGGPAASPETIVPPVASPPRRAVRPRPAAGTDDPAPPRLTARRAEPPRHASAPRDRLMLSAGGEAGDLPLQLATELSSLAGGLTANETQREIMRLEFRMLMVLNEQALTQMATAEKLRNMEGTLGELRQLAGNFGARVEKEAPVSLPPAGLTEAPAPAATIRSEGGAPRFSAWSLYGALLGVLLGVGGWLGWRHFDRRRQQDAESFPLLAADQVVLASEPVADEVDRAVDIRVEPARPGAATAIDVELDGGDAVSARPAGEARMFRPVARDSVMSLEATTVDEHFEANPVMELADIMLSFGRVKGAAQALQEYIDTNPQEALQPWIRLMDVYRMAGMRNEFENVARNLNQQFNVEVQHWDQSSAVAVDLDVDEGAPRAPRADSLEDLPRIMSMVSELWWTGDVVGYLYQLLRDNRGGKRAGFALPLVEEILFLIELKETSNRIEKKDKTS